MDATKVPGGAAGTYTGHVTVSDPAGVAESAAETVVLIVVAAPKTTPAYTLTPNYLEFTSVAGTAPATQSITLTNTGASAFYWSVDSANAWIAFSTASGTLEPGKTAKINVSVPAGENVASSRGTINVQVPGGTDREVIVVRNITSTAGQQDWSSSSETTLTLPVAATGMGGAQGSFWSSDVFAAPMSGGAQRAMARDVPCAMDYALQVSALPEKQKRMLETAKARMEEEALKDGERGSSRFIWGAISQKACSGRSAEAQVTELDLTLDESYLLADMLGSYFDQESASGMLQVRGPEVQNLLMWSRTYTTDANGWTYGQDIPTPKVNEVIMGGGKAAVAGLRGERITAAICTSRRSTACRRR